MATQDLARSKARLVKAVLALMCLLALPAAPAPALPRSASGSVVSSPATCTRDVVGVRVAVAADVPCAAVPGVAPAASTTAGATPLPGPCAPVPVADDRCEAWVARYNGVAKGGDGIGSLVSPPSLATSPDGSTVFAVGGTDASSGSAQDYDLLVVAFDGATGQLRWSATWPGTELAPQVENMGIAVDPRGRWVAAAATAYRSVGADAAVALFDAGDGSIRWAQVVKDAQGLAITAAADGEIVALAGSGRSEIDGQAHGTVTAFATADGAMRWTYTDPTPRTSAWRLATHPSSDRIYSASTVTHPDGHATAHVLTVLDSATGVARAVTQHDIIRGFPPAGLAVSADGSRVVVEAANLDTALNNALTIAYDADGTKLWTARYRGCDQFKCSTRPWYAQPVTVTPDGSTVVITSLGVHVTAVTVFHTVAYDAATGAQKWAAQYEVNGGDCFCGPGITSSPDSSTVFTSGFMHATHAGGDNVTIAYDAASGARKWTAIHRPDLSAATAHLAVSPDGRWLFAGGGVAAAVPSGDDFADVLVAAYDAT